MGYDVYITRGPNTLDPGENAISLDEWLTHAESDPTLELDDQARFVAWTGGTPSLDGRRILFEFRDGQLVVKTPDEEALEKIREVARALDARVLGEEGEAY